VSDIPPEIELTDEQKRELGRFRAHVARATESVVDRLMDMKLSPEKATSVVCVAFFEESAKQATMSALLDKREPNKNWFLQNCEKYFDNVNCNREEQSNGSRS